MSGHLPMGDGAEFDAIRSLLAEWGDAAQGIGDDAASLAVPVGERLLASTDASVEGVHFRRGWLTAEQIGARAATAALSDLAAMAAAPLGMLLALSVPDAWRAELPALARGVASIARACRAPIVGGNLTGSSELALCITVLGSAARALRRDGARAGDRLWVTGALGGPGAALRALLAGQTPEPEHLARFVAPEARIAAARWLASHGARAAIDVSDGLHADAGHLARASRVCAVLDAARIPCVAGVSPDDAIASGEEYELLVALPADASPDREEFARRFGVAITEIGRVEPPEETPVRVEGARVDHPRGHDHFS